LNSRPPAPKAGALPGCATPRRVRQPTASDLRRRVPGNLGAVRTVVLGPRPAELEALIERRRRLGQDLYDEVWEGEYHVVPGPSFSHADLQAELIAILRPLARARGLRVTGAFNVGEPDDFRVPDIGVHRSRAGGVWLPSAALVVEVVSPDDESYAKFGFYARHRVDEIVIADPATRALRIWSRRGDQYDETDRSEVLDVTREALHHRIDWPDPPA
jgi:Uma2 family endonuclease